MCHSLSDDQSLFWPAYLVLKIKKPLCFHFWEMFASLTPVWSHREMLGPQRVQTLQEQTGAIFSSQTKYFLSFSTFYPILKSLGDETTSVSCHCFHSLPSGHGHALTHSWCSHLPCCYSWFAFSGETHVYVSCGNPLLLCFPSECHCSSPGWILVLAWVWQVGLAHPWFSLPAVLEVVSWGWLL